MKYPQSFIEEIRARVRVSEVIGRAIPLKRAGREFHALCPFHKEKSPSFTVNDEKGFFHCFGCGAHGDVIGFTMDYEHLGYREAVERLAGVAGLSLPKVTHEEAEKERKNNDLFDVMKAVAAWFEDQLANTPEAENARDYLDKRQLNNETRSKFRLGYAPADRDALTRAMKPLGITEEQLIQTGMLIKVEDRAPYSRFRRRLMFPIRDRRSRVIAFGGRVLPDEPNVDAPKYLNSPETPLFHKGRQLFNLDLARRAALDSNQLIVCEGYMDVIALAQEGIMQAVAPLGTAITAEQLQLCWATVNEPILCLDTDSAGMRAMGRALDLALPLLAENKTLKFAWLNPNEDPDELVKTPDGKQQFQEMLRDAKPLAEEIYRAYHKDSVTTPEAKAAQKSALDTLLNTIKNPDVQRFYKQYMRDRWYKQREEEYQKKLEAKEKKQKQEKLKDKTSGMGVPPRLGRKDDTSLLAPATNLLGLVIAWPPLLQDASAEEFWLHAPMPTGWQQTLHHLITELHIESPNLNSEELMQMLTEEASAESLAMVTKAMNGLGIDLAKDDLVRSGRAQRLWGEVVNDADRARLRAEIVEAEQLLASELNDENFNRLTHLKSQLEAIDRERSRFYREDAI